MSKTLTEVTRDAADLSERERSKLVRILLDLSEGEIEPTPDVQEDWDREIERRLAELRTGKVKGVPLEDVKRKIESRWPS
jgi:putative addiction module component (TIGR02574 family)